MHPLIYQLYLNIVILILLYIKYIVGDYVQFRGYETEIRDLKWKINIITGEYETKVSLLKNKETGLVPNIIIYI